MNLRWIHSKFSFMTTTHFIDNPVEIFHHIINQLINLRLLKEIQIQQQFKEPIKVISMIPRNKILNSTLRVVTWTIWAQKDNRQAASMIRMNVFQRMDSFNIYFRKFKALGVILQLSSNRIQNFKMRIQNLKDNNRLILCWSQLQLVNNFIVLTTKGTPNLGICTQIWKMNRFPRFSQV